MGYEMTNIFCHWHLSWALKYQGGVLTVCGIAFPAEGTELAELYRVRNAYTTFEKISYVVWQKHKESIYSIRKYMYAYYVIIICCKYKYNIYI